MNTEATEKARLLANAVLGIVDDDVWREELTAQINFCKELATDLLACIPPGFPFIDNESRCAVCGWVLADSVEAGCVRGNCSMRPRPARPYCPERAAKEAQFHAPLARRIEVRR